MNRNSLFNKVILILLLIAIISTIYFYDELKRLEYIRKNNIIDIHGTFYSEDVSKPGGEDYQKTFWILYMVFDSEKMEYTLHSGGLYKAEKGSYKVSKYEKNVIYLTRYSDGKESYINIDPVDKSFIYVFDLKSDDVRKFIKIHDHLTYVQ